MSISRANLDCQRKGPTSSPEAASDESVVMRPDSSQHLAWQPCRGQLWISALAFPVLD